MPLESVGKIDARGKAVLVRVDYNTELSGSSQEKDHFRIASSRQTIDLLFKQGAKVALLTHFGRPNGPDPEYSTEKLLPYIEKNLERKVRFIAVCLGEEIAPALATLKNNEVLLLENVRFASQEEAGNDSDFAQKLASPFAYYVNEAFSNSHRSHASMAAITRFLPSYGGLRLLEEMAALERIRLEPEHPAVAIIGGAKIETKLPLIQALELNYDAILVGGKIANEALDRCERFSDKVHLPKDFDGPERLDIGPKTIEEFRQVIARARTIVWNGPLGKFEEPAHEAGTEAILEAILASQAFSVMGGGESLDILNRANAAGKIGFVSTGGGAMLEYLSGKKLPALVALEKSKAS